MKTTHEWKKYHQTLLSILKEFGFGVKSMMESRIQTEIEFLTDYALKQNGESFNPGELARLSTTNIMMNIIFGRRRDYSLGMSEIAHQTMRNLANIDMALDVAPILRFLPFHRNNLREYVDSTNRIRNILRIETEKSLEDGADDCFVRRYIECMGPDYDSEQLEFTLRGLVGAGTDTTTNALLWTLIALANNQDVQDRLRAEVDLVVPQDRLPSLNDQPKLPFVEATILEILRWRTLVPLALPHTTLSDTSAGEYFIPQETLVI